MMLGPSRIVIELPPLATHEAALIVEIFDQISAQLWDRHGEEMADYLDRDRDIDAALGSSDIPF